MHSKPLAAKLEVEAHPMPPLEHDKEIFSIEVTMQRRWIPHFLGMLREMQALGAVGSSRRVSFMSDGDGDFRPEFEWLPDLPEPAEPRERDGSGHTFFDAG